MGLGGVIPVQNIVTGQQISQTMTKRAKEFRKEMTPAEKALWQHLRAGRLNGFHFKRQQIIDPYIVDFYCHVSSLAVEVDGGIHLEQEGYDGLRDDYLRQIGLRVLRFSNIDVSRNLDVVLNRILEACENISMA